MQFEHVFAVNDGVALQQFLCKESESFLSNIYLEITSTSVYHLKFYCRSQKLQNWQRIPVIVPKRWFTSMNNSGKKTGNKLASKVICILYLIFNYFVSHFRICMSFPILEVCSKYIVKAGSSRSSRAKLFCLFHVVTIL